MKKILIIDSGPKEENSKLPLSMISFRLYLENNRYSEYALDTNLLATAVGGTI